MPERRPLARLGAVHPLFGRGDMNRGEQKTTAAKEAAAGDAHEVMARRYTQEQARKATQSAPRMIEVPRRGGR
jgi:hypothetical protein